MTKHQAWQGNYGVVRRGGRARVTTAGVADVDYGPCGMRVGAKINLRRLPKRAHATNINPNTCQIL
eukprot:574883-Prymnesium_polylepis.1